MWWSKQKDKRSTPLKDRTAGLIANGIIIAQIRASQLLGKWERTLKPYQKKFLLILFTTCCSAYLIYVLVTAWQNNAADPAGGMPDMVPPILPPKDGKNSFLNN